MMSCLVVSDGKEVFDALCESLRSSHKFDHVSNKDAALEMLMKKRYDLIFIDVAMLRESVADNRYKEGLQQLRNSYPAIQVIVMSSQEMVREAVNAVKAGANDYLTYPVNFDEAKYVVESLHESFMVQSELDYLRDQFWQAGSLELVQTKSHVMKQVFAQIRSVAPTKSTVLLIGETGTGKGLFARLIHQHSNRRDAQFISVHCGAIPDTLLESELFGHEKGAFTGAVRRKLGKFEIAKGGTIFMDEIATITPAAQIKLLQVLQDGTFQRVGGEETLEADVRVIAATNMDLKQMCEEGQFRRDLYYRLNVFPVEIPPLRERKEDIAHIVEVILGRLNRLHLKEVHHIQSDVMEAFRNYSWPGNIRELENLIERAYIIENSSMLTPEGFPNELFTSSSARVSIDVSAPLTEVRRKGVEDIERRYLKELLSQHRGCIKESAKAAGITTRQLHKLLTKYDIRKEEFKPRRAMP